MEMIIRRFDAGEPSKFDDSFHQLHEIENLPAELEEFRQGIREIIFLTGNKNKLNELNSNLKLKNIKLSCPEVKIDLPEIQNSNILNIVQDKCQRAYERIIQEDEFAGGSADPEGSRVVLVEDTSLNFQALKGMPGPYVKWFLDAIGPEGLFKMLAGFPNKSAEAICIYALMGGQRRKQHIDRGGIILFFRGLARGSIVEPRQASPTSGWGWDPIFEEERSRLTFAEMDQEVKSKFSHRANALTILRKFLEVQV